MTATDDLLAGRAGAAAADAGAPAGWPGWMPRTRSLAAADAICLRLAARHEENFTVASRLLPPLFRLHLARVYAYCRVTDDLGDESITDATAVLLSWRDEVERVLLHGGEPEHDVLLAVRETVRARALPAGPFLDLIAANLQDQRVHAYEAWPELLAYCRLSAAPVGRLVLGIAGVREPRAERLADDVCIGLQLANFAQDVAVDARKGRRYLLGDDVRAHGVRGAVRLMCARAEELLSSGEELERLVDGRLAAQLGLYRRGGLAILDAIRVRGHRTDEERPSVSTAAKLRLVTAATPGLLRPHAAPSTAAEGFCQEMARTHAANFYWGFVMLPRPQRSAIYAAYAFARQVDDDADDPRAFNPRERLDQQRRRLRRALAGAVEDPVMEVLVAAVRRYAIPVDELEAIIDGVERDVRIARYASWTDLAAYCRLVASSVGRICVRIFGFADCAALALADELGLAMQLTNILRDVAEDAGMGRIYLPADEMARFGVSEEHVLRRRPSTGWDELVAFEAARARALFASGLRVTELIPRRAAACVRTMAGIYEEILADIEAAPRRPLEERISLSPARKLAVLARSAGPAAMPARAPARAGGRP